MKGKNMITEQKGVEIKNGAGEDHNLFIALISIKSFLSFAG
jgi:hypothetical protein